MLNRLDARERKRRDRQQADRESRAARAGSGVVGTALRNYNELGRSRPDYAQTPHNQIYVFSGSFNRGMFNTTRFNSTPGFSTRDPYTITQSFMAGWGLGVWGETFGFSEGA